MAVLCLSRGGGRAQEPCCPSCFPLDRVAARPAVLLLPGMINEVRWRGPLAATLLSIMVWCLSRF